MFGAILRLVALAAVIALLPTDGRAHCFVGSRFFPATLNIDDPCVADELSLPTISRFKNGDNAAELDIAAEYSKRITDSFGISVGSTWTRLRPPDGPAVSGFQNLESSFKFQFLTDTAREFVMSAALEIEWGRTGSAAVGADPFTTLTPTLFIGKGFGALPDSVQYLKPFAITAQVGYSVPTQSVTTSIDSDSGMLVT